MALSHRLPLVGREEDLRVLERARARAQQGHATVVVLSGETGVGKSRLLEETAARARARGLLVLTTTGSTLHQDLDWAVIVDLVRPLVRPDAPVPGFPAKNSLVAGLSALTALFDGLDLPRASALGDAGLERTRLYEAVRELLARACRRVPLVLVVDDAQWADPTSLTVLQYCVRGLQTYPMLVVLASRSGVGGGGVEDIAASLRPLDLVIDRQIRPLDADGVRRLAAGVLSGEPPRALLALLAERAGGVPLFVRSMIAVLEREGRLRQVGGSWVLSPVERLTIPPEIRDLVRARLGSLDSRSRLVMEVVAVGGGSVPHEILASVVPTPASTLDPVVELVEAGLLLEETKGPRLSYRVAHPLLAEATYDALPEARRRHLHAAFVRALQSYDDSDRTSLLAHHMTGAGDRVHAAEALPVVEAALERAVETNASSAAVHFAEAALSLARRLGREDVVDRLQARRATALELSGRASEALVAWRAVAERATAANGPLQAGEAWHRVAVLEWEAGLFQAALAHVEEAKNVLVSAARLTEPDSGSGDGNDRALVRAELVAVLSTRLRLLQRSTGHIAKAAAELEALATRAGSAEGRARAALASARLAMRSGTITESLSLLESAASLAAEADDLLLRHEVARVQMSVGLERGDHAGTLLIAQRGLREARDQGLPAVEATYLESAAFAQFQAGSWADAERDANELFELAALLGSPRVRASALVIRGLLHALRGDFAAAAGFIRAIRGSYGEGAEEDRHLFVKADLVASLVDLGEGRPEAVVTRAEQAGQRAPVMVSFSALLAAEALCRVGLANDVLALADMLRTLAPPGTFPVAVADQVEGFAARASGDLASARVSFHEAALSLDALGLPYHAANAWLDWAEVADIDDGDADVRGRMVRERLSVLAALGVRPGVERARRILRDTSERGKRNRVERPLLTAREMEVARLVAEGLANAEIARRLCISTRTVTTHLQHVYARLDISSRTALARYVLTEAGRASPDDA